MEPRPWDEELSSVLFVCFVVTEQCWPPTKQCFQISCMALLVLGGMAAVTRLGIPIKPASMCLPEVMDLAVTHLTSKSTLPSWISKVGKSPDRGDMESPLMMGGWPMVCANRCSGYLNRPHLYFLLDDCLECVFPLFLFLLLKWLYPWHIEVPRPGSESKLQLWSFHSLHWARGSNPCLLSDPSFCSQTRNQVKHSGNSCFLPTHTFLRGKILRLVSDLSSLLI